MEGFIEVSEGEETSELDNSVTKSEEQIPEMSNREEESDKEESQENDSSDRTLSLNNSKMEEHEAESSRETSSAPAPSEWDNIDLVRSESFLSVDSFRQIFAQHLRWQCD